MRGIPVNNENGVLAGHHAQRINSFTSQFADAHGLTACRRAGTSS